MCTVSAISFGDGFRLVCNRDELLVRPIALPPVVTRFGERNAVMPIDPQSNGTWIAVNDAGLAMALLNVNVARCGDVRGERCSRGEIIPSLLHCEDVAGSLDVARAVNPLHFQPFRLVILDRHHWADVYSDAWDIGITSRPFDGAPLMFTSSGLGDTLVDHPRREMFDTMVRTADVSPQRQDAFHAHQWPERLHLSVMMSRADARTVSQTIIETTEADSRLIYIADGRRRVSQLQLHQLQTT